MPLGLSAKDMIKERFCAEPNRYYKVSLFDEWGFRRKQCKKCKKWFWTLNEDQTICPDPPCTTYGFIKKPPSRWKKDYVQTWHAIERFFVKNGHTSVPSYPTVCRWFPGLYFTIASIVAFQRASPAGPVFEFPANPLVIPQVCMRFNDIPNVGVSGRHFTSFIMVGQHSLYDQQNKQGYWKDRCIDLDWQLLTDIFKIPAEEISFVEDVWVGPSAFGYSLEYFVRGLELGNAVFTEFVGTPDNYRPMKQKVIDMGAGHERFVWLLHGTPTAYDAVFGTTINPLKKQIDYDDDLWDRYSRIAGGLNLDEISNVDAVRADIARSLGVDFDTLKKTTAGLEGIYAVADHARSLLYAITDGQLPSNVGGGYNLRVILRRALSIIENLGLDVDIFGVCEAHARYLKSLDRRLVEGLSSVQEILAVEGNRYKEHRGRTIKFVEGLLSKNTQLSSEKLVELYESNGITPELIKELASSRGVSVSISPDTYQNIMKQKAPEQIKEKALIVARDLPQTRLLFYEDQKLHEFAAKVLKIIDNKWVVLDQTAFFARSGGQEPDHGKLEACRVYDVEKIGDVIIHAVEDPTFKEGNIIHGKIDWQRRHQIMLHHTATHAVNGACKRVLGMHVWQHGAKKDEDKAHIDITHYENVSYENLIKIERVVNELIQKNILLKKHIVPRLEAEHKWGFGIYQGGAIPAATLRIVEIPGFDIEACGGTHADSSIELEDIVIIGSERIQDGIIRISYVSGPAAKKERARINELISRSASILGVDEENLLDNSRILLSRWRDSRKTLESKTQSAGHDIASSLEHTIVNGILVAAVDGDRDLLQNISAQMSSPDKLLILFGIADKVYVWVASGENRTENAGEIASKLAQRLGGRGGGTKMLGQGVGADKDEVGAYVSELKKQYGQT
jgi:alanyl-tRNA synthetase